MSAERVSLIIPHKGRTELLSRTLQSIASLDYDRALLEVLVVTQEPGLTLSPEQNPCGAQIIQEKETLTIAALRNAGVAQSSGEFLVFLDADVELPREWLTVMMSELSEPGRILIGSVQRCNETATAIQRIRASLSAISADSCVEALISTNLICRKKEYALAGGFPEHLRTCEDIYFSGKMKELGILYLTGKTQYFHLGEDPDFRVLFKKEIWRSISNFESMRGRHIPLREWPSFVVPLSILGGVLLLVFALVTQKRGVGILGAVWVVAITLLYTLRVYRTNRSLGLLSIWRYYLVYFAGRAIGSGLGGARMLRIKPWRKKP